MLIILFSLLFLSIASREYHLDRQIPLCCMKDIKNITPLLNGGIAIEAANPAITILNGSDFSIKITEIQADSFVSQIVVSTDGRVYFVNGSKIIQKTAQN
jgi:hypothetical protein